jgi:phenylalanyl-tRNA synthetase beta chain
VQREVDLVEEVGRVHGLDRIPATLPARRRAIGRLTRAQLLRRRLEDALRDRGLTEAVSYAFTAPEKLVKLRLPSDATRLANPLSEEQSVMRPLILPGLLDAARHNAAHGNPGARLFESAHAYPPSRTVDGVTPVPERHHVAALLTGPPEAGWRTPAPPLDFYSGKALLEALLDAAAVAVRFEPGERPFLHPGRSASVVSQDGRELGWLGEVHPGVLGQWDLDAGVAFEVDADTLAELAPEAIAYREAGRFPPVLDDIAIAVPEDVPSAEIEGLIEAAGGDLVERVELFDVYRGEQLRRGYKSLAYRLRFRSPERTLTEDDARALRAEIERAVERVGGRVRVD